MVLAPVVSEKSTFVADKNRQYVFRVADDATKPEIKAAVELMFKTKVDASRCSNVKGKERRFGRTIGRRRSWKKAYVRLAAGPGNQLRGDGIRTTAMPLVKVKPTSPGRRALVKVVTPELHKGEPHWPLLSSQSKTAAAATTTAASPCATRAAATSSTTASSISAATRTASRPRSSASSTTRTAARTSRCCSTPTASAAT